MGQRVSNIAAILLLMASVGGCNSRVLEDGGGEDAALADSFSDDMVQVSVESVEPVTVEGYLGVLVWDDFEHGRSGVVYDLCTTPLPGTCYELLFSPMDSVGLTGGLFLITGMLNSSNNTITLSPDDATRIVD